MQKQKAASHYSGSKANNIAYILVKCKIGHEERVIYALGRFSGVQAIDQIYGAPYDIIVKVTSDTIKELDLIIRKIRRTKEIISTQTLLVGEFA